jgi:glyoxylase-like metal-dependent hydrolase (beta-lactamase superfamily II)
MDRKIRMFGVLAVLLGVAWGLPAQAQDAQVKRSIDHISGGLYKFTNRFHASVFLVTDAGIIATDPINAEAARWLKAELDKRFGKPVKYLIYSHHHADHVSGGEVFADTAEIVAHENSIDDFKKDKVPTALPTLTFSDTKTITLGGQSVELIYLGSGHSDNMIAIKFPAEQALFIVDIVSAHRLPYRTMGAGRDNLDGILAQIRKAESITNYNKLITAHGAPYILVAKPGALRQTREYIETLRRNVQAEMDAGKSLDEIKQSVRMEDYQNLFLYDQFLPLNIEGMYTHLGGQQ